MPRLDLTWVFSRFNDAMALRGKNGYLEFMSKRAVMLLSVFALMPANGMSAEAVCSCVANGQTYQLGEIACFTLPNGQKRARCDRVLNNTSWTFLDDECPSASIDGDGTRFALMCPRPDLTGQKPATPDALAPAARML